jgi:hypothetical protein
VDVVVPVSVTHRVPGIVSVVLVVETKLVRVAEVVVVVAVDQVWTIVVSVSSLVSVVVPMGIVEVLVTVIGAVMTKTVLLSGTVE